MPDNSPENPYDEFLKKIAQIVEDITKNIPDNQNCRFIGCTIISGNVPGELFPGAPGTENHEALQYEMIESEDRIYITARIPSWIHAPPEVDIQAHAVRIHAGGREATIALRKPADISHSFYRVRHGLIDIVVSNLQVPAPDS